MIYIANSLLEQREDYEKYIELIEKRRSKHFYEKYQNIYEAIYYTVKMHEFIKNIRHGIPSRASH